MAFGKLVGTATTAASAPKEPGGRYAGIRPPSAGVDTLKAGEYILELKSCKKSRKGTTALIDCVVLESATPEGSQPDPSQVKTMMINFGGNSFDMGMSRVLSLAMALCNCETLAQLATEEPHYDELMDLICGQRVDSKIYGDDPVSGRKIWARGYNSATLAQRGDPFVNWEFGIAKD
jgi:hypothetical protein